MMIDNFRIGANHTTFIVAELSANHNNNFDTAVASLQAAKEAGADAVKLQTYTPDTITIDCDNEYFQIKQGTIWDGQTLYQLYQKAYTPWEWQPRLQKRAENLGLIFFSTPFDKTAVDFLAALKVPAYKIASFEITDIPLIEYVARQGKPVLISTGIATMQEIAEAINACKRSGNEEIILLKCTSSYPAPIEEANVLTIPDMMDRFNLPVGLSDHTIGFAAAAASVALGACIVEKHFIIDRKVGGPDAEFSMEPAEFKAMTDTIRAVEKSLGEVSYSLTEEAEKNRYFCRSLFVVKDIQPGEAFTENNVRSIRPGAGLSPKHFNEILGKKSVIALARGTPLQWEHLK